MITSSEAVCSRKIPLVLAIYFIGLMLNVISIIIRSPFSVGVVQYLFLLVEGMHFH